FGQQCRRFWCYFRIRSGKYITLTPCRSILSKQCGALGGRPGFKVKLQVCRVQLIQKPARFTAIKCSTSVTGGCVTERELLRGPGYGYVEEPALFLKVAPGVERQLRRE